MRKGSYMYEYSYNHYNYTLITIDVFVCRYLHVTMLNLILYDVMVAKLCTLILHLILQRQSLITGLLDWNTGLYYWNQLFSILNAVL